MNNSPLPKDAREERETALLFALLKKEKEKIEAPEELLKKILKKHELSKEVSGRFSWLDKFKNLIKTNIMEKKMKLALSSLGVVVILLVAIFALQSDKIIPQSAQKKDAPVEKNKLAVSTPVIGNEKIDAAINESLKNILDEENFDSEMEDIELASLEETELEEINNLINDDEL